MGKMIDMANKFVSELRSTDPKLHAEVIAEIESKSSEELSIAFSLSVVTGGLRPSHSDIATQMSIMHVLLTRKDATAKKFLERIIETEIKTEEALKARGEICNCPACTAERRREQQPTVN